MPLWRRLFRGFSSAQPHISNLVNTQTEATYDVHNKQASEPALVPPPVNTQPQISAAVENIANSPVTEPYEADWTVKYNTTVRQTLDIHLAHTLKVKSAVFRLKFSRDGKYLAVALKTGETHIYDIKTMSKRILAIVEYPQKEQPPMIAMQFSPDDKYIATGGAEGELRVWNIAERRILATFKGHIGTVLSVDFSPNGRFLVSGSVDNSVRIWCMRDGSSKQLLDTKMSPVVSTAISPDGRYVAAGHRDGMLRIWDLRSGQLLEKWKAKDHIQCLWSVVFTLDGKGLLSGGKDKTLRFWDISSLMASRSKRALHIGEELEKECLTFQQHTGDISSVSGFSDSRWVISGSGDSTVRIWDAQTGAWQCKLPNGHKKVAGAADASPDGLHLATGSRDGLVGIWRYERTEF